MIYHKSSIAKRPFKLKISFRRKHWYLYPMAQTWRKSVAEINYEGKVDAHRHKHFWLIYAYHFTWLFVNVYWELDTSERLSESVIRHEPLQYTTGEGEIFKA